MKKLLGIFALISLAALASCGNDTTTVSDTADLDADGNLEKVEVNITEENHPVEAESNIVDDTTEMLDDAGDAIVDGGEAVVDGVQNAGEAVVDGVQDVYNAVTKDVDVDVEVNDEEDGDTKASE